jgi:hypothetical protein
VAAFLGYPDHSARADCHVLHDARTGARDWEGKSAADIFRSTARPSSLSDALMAETKHESWTVISMKDDWKTIFPLEKN